jgi:hypothetical protein
MMATYTLLASLLNMSIDSHDSRHPDCSSATTRVIDPLGTRMVQSQGLHGRWVVLGKLHQTAWDAKLRVFLYLVGFRPAVGFGSEYQSN